MNTIDMNAEGIVFIDQTLLPKEEKIVTCKSVECLIEAIQSLRVRGAPALGAAGAYGVTLSARYHISESVDEFFLHIIEESQKIANARPTAVNLQWGVNAQLDILKKRMPPKITLEILEKNAKKIALDDIANNKQIGEYGSTLIEYGDGVLTHCNAGALACVGYGTALGVIRSAHRNDKNIHVFVDETRPLCQGSRLTAWEMVKENIPATLITDNMAGSLMKAGKIQKVVVGADRITSNGDVANKIGTYSVAVLAHYHKIPMIVAAPVATIDYSISDGDDIPIEQRDSKEIIYWQGSQNAPLDIAAYNPAFDVTPASLISAIVTEKGIATPPFDKSLSLFKT